MSTKTKTKNTISSGANIKGGLWSTQGVGILKMVRVTERSPIGFSVTRVSRR